MGVELVLIVCAAAMVAGLVVFVARTNRTYRTLRQTVLAALRAQLDNATGDDDTLVAGTRDGLDVKFHLTHTGSGKSRVILTDVVAELPSNYPLAIYLRPHGLWDRGKIERGEMVDLTLDDAAFDARFVVEAAPADVVRRLLDATEREYLLGLRHHLELATITERGRRLLRLRIHREWVTEVPRAQAAVDAVLRIAARVRDAFAAADEQAPVARRGDAYRPMLDDATRRAAAVQRDDEVAHVEQVRERRARSERVVVIVVVSTIAALFALGLVLSATR